ncbi:MAG: Regulatory protein RecX [uncultured Thiotrichaceae bacterium]|uniref:Regulatory protein RecX n=1 Tax=uncultured Thiotrichaceae bacterium TaxID=298394 RepID=A0A6S6UDN2_9GAMM|nr:MAG: Regulatory protein RecX [uncultured Thiotrichaceae bacterium]
MLKKEKSQRRCLDVAYGLLARREHSRSELQNKLAQRDNCAEDDIDELLDLLAADNIQSDERFVESMVRSAINKGQGPVKIRYKLQEHGVDSSLIAIYLDNAEVDWGDVLHQARCKRFGDTTPNDYPTQAKQSRFLAGRGFSAEMINKEFIYD